MNSENCIIKKYSTEEMRVSADVPSTFFQIIVLNIVIIATLTDAV